MEYTKTKKQVFLTFISNHGLNQNSYATEIIDAEIILSTWTKLTVIKVFVAGCGLNSIKYLSLLME